MENYTEPMLRVNFFQYTSEYKVIDGTAQSSIGGQRAECRAKKFVTDYRCLRRFYRAGKHRTFY